MADDTMTVTQAREVLLGDIRYCISAVRCDSSAPVGDCSAFVDALIAAVRAENAADIALLKRDRQIALNAALIKDEPTS